MLGVWKKIGFFLLASLICHILSAEDASGEALYGYKNARGVVTFTSKKPRGKNYWRVQKRTPVSSVVIRRASSRGRRRWLSPRRSRFDHMIKHYAKKHSLEPALIKAVVHAESSFNPRARSHKGARGLMQLMPATAKRFGISNSYSPMENVMGGVRYLRWLFDHFNGNIHYVLAGYNAGEGAVAKYRGIPPYSETKEYIRRVLLLRSYYRCDFSGQRRCNA